MSYQEYMEIYNKVLNNKNDLVAKWTQEALKEINYKIYLIIKEYDE